MKTSSSQPNANSTDADWVKTPVANLVRYKPSGIYFARVCIRGKLFRQSLQSNVISVAKLRLADFIQQKIEELGDEPAKQSGRMTFNDALAIFRQRLDGKQDIKEGAKIYRRKCIEALVKSWPELEEKLVSKVSKEECLAWARKFSSGYCPSVYNNTVGTLRMILDIAVEMGARAVSPHPSTPSYLPRRPDILLWGNGDGLGLVLEKVQDRVGPDLKTPAQGDELIAALS